MKSTRLRNYCGKTFFVLFSLSLLQMVSCTTDSNSSSENVKKTASLPKENNEPIKFESLPSTQTKIEFENTIDIAKSKPPYYYVNVYNGGGVSIGDINNDGLADVFFTGNFSDNKLYLNQGDMKFVDITQRTGLSIPNRWCTGATMADVNNDGFLDIYVCLAYLDKPDLMENQLFINNGNMTFTEMGKAYGINDSGYSVQAAFFDFDNDNDLDLIVGNHPPQRDGYSIEDHYQRWKKPTGTFTDRLYKNNGNNTFTDITEEAGILNYGFTLGLSVSDFNDDGYLDIYLAVDHTEPDILFENNKDGTFTNTIKKRLQHTSFSSMGTDVGDINNDGLLDLYCVDMLSKDNYRQKAQMGSMNPGLFWKNIDRGFHYSIMRNQLQLNNGNGTFAEIAQMAGVHNTDWSWSPLLADLNNNGFKDLFVSNGYLVDLMDKDDKNLLKDKIKKAKKSDQRVETILTDFTLSLSRTPLQNYCYYNNGDLTFKDVSNDSGLGFESFSNGAAYSDLDNDGDLDIVINNINKPASIMQNNAEKLGNNYLKVKVNGDKSIQEIGTKVFVESTLGKQVHEYQFTRGYQSSVDPILHFGLGDLETLPIVTVQWLDGKTQTISNVKANQILEVHYKDAVATNSTTRTQPLFAQSNPTEIQNVKHTENAFDDYKKQILLPHKMSQFGPHLEKGDINGDGTEDLFIGGAAGQPASLLVQGTNGNYSKKDIPAFNADAKQEDLGACFFDIDNDKDLDLYVVSGGNMKDMDNPIYQDRLYINDGSGNFIKSSSLPSITSSGSCAKAGDFDNDGDMDLFIGGRHVPGMYPKPASSYLLINDGGTLTIADEKTISTQELGMVTDATWTDLNHDGKLDLLVVGEWMPVTTLIQVNGTFEDQTKNMGLDKTVGWWNSIQSGDFDKDGNDDFVLGNLGENYKYKASPTEAFHIYANDFDDNGTYDIALGYLYNDAIVPLRGRQCSSESVPGIADKFPNYDSFAKATIDQVYGKKLATSLHYSATHFSSSILSETNGKLTLTPLPNQTQLAPINGAVILDTDNDGYDDIIVGGNLFVSEVETGRADAGTGLILKNLSGKGFSVSGPNESGIYIPGDVKDLKLIKNQGKNSFDLVVANNNGPIQLFRKPQS